MRPVFRGDNSYYPPPMSDRLRKQFEADQKQSRHLQEIRNAMQRRYEQHIQTLLTREPELRYDREESKRLSEYLGANRSTPLQPTIDLDEINYFLGKPIDGSGLDDPRYDYPFNGNRFTALDRSYPELAVILRARTRSIRPHERLLAAPGSRWITTSRGTLGGPMPVDDVWFVTFEPNGRLTRSFTFEPTSEQLYGVITSFLMNKIDSGLIQLRADERRPVQHAEAELEAKLEQLVHKADPTAETTGTVRLKRAKVAEVAGDDFGYLYPHLLRVIGRDKAIGSGIFNQIIINESHGFGW